MEEENYFEDLSYCIHFDSNQDTQWDLLREVETKIKTLVEEAGLKIVDQGGGMFIGSKLRDSYIVTDKQPADELKAKVEQLYLEHFTFATEEEINAEL